MQHINLTYFVDFGSELALLRSFAAKQVDVPLIEAWPPLGQVQDKLVRLLQGHPVRLEVSTGPANALLTELNAIRVRHFDGPDGVLNFDKNWAVETVPAWEFMLLPLDAFQNVLAAEFNGSATFFVPQRWGYHTPTLIMDAAICADLAGRPDFTGTALVDLREAGKCLAFEMPTACGFHAARSVEAILQRYYEVFIGPLPERGQMGPLLAKLEKQEAEASGLPRPDPRTLRTLREIKDLDRNPLAHPDATLDMLDAKALFELAGIAISRMLRDMLLRSAQQPPATSSPAIIAS